MPLFEVYTLSDYIPKTHKPLSQLAEIQRKKVEDATRRLDVSEEFFLSQLNSQGTKILGRLSKTLRRGDIFNHAIRMELRNPFALQQIGKILITPDAIKEDISETLRPVDN